MVTFYLPLAANSGRYLTTGSSKSSLLCLVELHDGGRGGEALGERGHVEDGVDGHGLGGGGFAVETGFVGVFADAVGLLEDDLAVVADEEDCAGEFLLGDGGVDGGGGGGEVVGGGLGGTAVCAVRVAVSKNPNSAMAVLFIFRSIGRSPTR